VSRMPETVTVAHGVADRVEPATAREREAQRLAYTAAVDAMARELRRVMERELSLVKRVEAMEAANDRQWATICQVEGNFLDFRRLSFMARLRWVFRGR
jgi:hypothetical protein